MTGKQFAKIRKAAGLSQRQLAALCGMPYQSIQRFERGTRPLSQITMLTGYKLANALKIPMEDLVKDDAP